MPTVMTDADLTYVRHTIAMACASAQDGNRPFAAVLVGRDGSVLAESCDISNQTGDPLSHAEINVLRRAHVDGGLDAVAGGAIYVNAEPCTMCAGTILRYGLARVVYALSSAATRPYLAHDPRGKIYPSAPIFAVAGAQVDVTPEVLIEEAKRPFELYAAHCAQAPGGARAFERR